MPSDAAFREALEEYRLAFTADKHQPSNGPVPRCAGCDEVRRTLARVLALYAEVQRQGERGQLALAEQVAEATVRMEQGRAERQGEVYYVGAWRLDGSDRDLPAVALDAPFKPGDRVRVTKVEEGQ